MLRASSPRLRLVGAVVFSRQHLSWRVIANDARQRARHSRRSSSAAQPSPYTDAPLYDDPPLHPSLPGIHGTEAGYVNPYFVEDVQREAQQALSDMPEDDYLPPLDGHAEPQPRPRLQLAHYKPRPLRLITFTPREHAPSGHPSSKEHAPGEYWEGNEMEAEVFDDTLRAERIDWLNALGTTDSLEEGWLAYEALLSIPRDPHPALDALTKEPELHVPHRHLHRLAAMLASSEPPTRVTFLRLQAVLMTLHRSGGVLQIWQWNALIQLAGTGFRKLRSADMQRSLDIFADMVHRRAPGETLALRMSGGDQAYHGDGPSTLMLDEPDNTHARPNIVTYTTLLSVATRTRQVAIVKHARSLLRASGLVPTATTHLALLRYFTRAGDLTGVRDTFARMRARALEPGLDGINAAAWAFGRNARLDVAASIYRVLRHNTVTEVGGDGPEGIEAARQYLDEVENIIIPDGMVPDATTYTILVQCFAYQGQLVPALRVFHDMLTTPDRDSMFGPGQHTPKAPQGRSGKRSPQPQPPPRNFEPIYPIYRALFLGFARHSTPLRMPRARHNANNVGLREPLTAHSGMHALHRAGAEHGWSHDQLHMLFKSFLALPHGTRPSERVIYWILIAFERTTGRDVHKLRKVYRHLEHRFGGRWGGRIGRIRQELFSESREGSL
jgi:hypothetical protein